MQECLGLPFCLDRVNRCGLHYVELAWLGVRDYFDRVVIGSHIPYVTRVLYQDVIDAFGECCVMHACKGILPVL